MHFVFIDPDGEKLEFKASKKDGPTIIDALICHWEGEEVTFGFSKLKWKEIARSKACDLAMIEFKSIARGDAT